MEFKDKLKALRKEANMTQEALASKLFVTRQAITNWENGRSVPNYDVMISVSKIFNIDLNELIDSPKEEEKKPQKKWKWIVALSCSSFIFLLAIATILIISNQTRECGYYIVKEEEILDLNHFDTADACVFVDEGDNVIRYGDMSFDWSIKSASIKLAYGEDYYLYKILKTNKRYKVELHTTFSEINEYEFTLKNKNINLLKVEVEDKVSSLKVSILDTNMSLVFSEEISVLNNNYILWNTNSKIEFSNYLELIMNG